MYKFIADEKGFTLLEMLIVMVILSILSSVAVPHFQQAIIMANTAKVQADLSALNTAINMHIIQEGFAPHDLQKDLSPYIKNIATPPKGRCFLRNGTTINIKSPAYTLNKDRDAALCQEKAYHEFGQKRESSSPSPTK